MCRWVNGSNINFKLLMFFIFSMIFLFLATNFPFLNAGTLANHNDIGLPPREYPPYLYGVDVEISCPKQVDLSGGAKLYEIQITNTGSLPETINVVLITEYLGNSINEHEIELESVGPGQEIDRQSIIELSVLFQDGESFKLIAIATVEEDPNETDTDEESILILAPGLSITDISFSKNKPNKGDKIKITATIFNNGHSEAYICTVRFFDNNQIIEELELWDVGIEEIPIGESVKISINWTATIGEHKIKVIIPRNGHYINPETEGTSSELSKEIVVEDISKLVPIFALITCIMVFAVIVFFLRRKHYFKNK